MKDIIKKFLNKCNANKKCLYFLYNGQIINGDLTLSKCANSLDRSRNYMNVLVLESQDSDNENSSVTREPSERKIARMQGDFHYAVGLIKKR